MGQVKQIILEIDRFLAITGMRPTTFGVAAVNDGHIIEQLRAGRNVRASTEDRIRAFITAHSPLAAKASTETRRICPHSGIPCEANRDQPIGSDPAQQDSGA